MKFYNWKVFNKKGSELNWYRDPYLNLYFTTPTQNYGQATGYAVTDPSGIITDSVITDSGWGYDENNTSAFLNFTFNAQGDIDITNDSSIFFKDVSIFNPYPSNTSGIRDVSIDISTNYGYPSLTFTGAIYLEPISKGLVSNELLLILEESSTGHIRPYDDEGGSLVLKMEGVDTQIALFSIDNDKQEIVWADEIEYDVSTYVQNTPLPINIGFRADDGGVFERRLKIFHRVNGIDFLFGEILVNAQSIDKDDRYDTHIQNFGLPDPKEIAHVFKEADTKEPLPDWQLLNYKAKNLIVDQHQIKPFIGTYKALVNSIKWLGYEDIQVKEWFENVEDGKKLSLYVPYDAEERSKTILKFSPEERKALKKLNSLSLVYHITKETGEIDEWGNPIVEERYDYNLDDIKLKIFNLKKWLENNIIGVNARITDVAGESVVYEKYKNFIYGTINTTTNGEYVQSLSPIAINERSELKEGSSKIDLTLKEFEKLKIQDFPYRFYDLIDYVWDPSNGGVSPDNSVDVYDFDASIIRVGSTFKFPFYDLSEIEWKNAVEKTYAGVLTSEYVTTPLFIYDNEIRFYNHLTEQSEFYESSTNLTVTLEQAYLRDPSEDIWQYSIEYSIYNENDNFILETSTGIKKTFSDLVSFTPVGSSTYLKYETRDNYKVPLFYMKNFQYLNPSTNTIETFEPGKEYILDIVDGKISVESDFVNTSGKYQEVINTINFNYDTDLSEQKITLNVEYYSKREPIFLYDPSIYYHYMVELNNNPSPSLVIDNSVYTMDVNHIGEYYIEVYGWNRDNHLFYNRMTDTYNVWTKRPTIYGYTDPCTFTGEFTISSSDYLSISDTSTLIENNNDPIYDKLIPLYGLKIKEDNTGELYIEIPSISFFVDTPESGSISRFLNLTEKVTQVVSLNTIDVNFNYQDFKVDDSINVVLFDKRKWSLTDQASNVVVDVSLLDSGLKLNRITLDSSLDANFTIDTSTEMYLQNSSIRDVYVSTRFDTVTTEVDSIVYDTSTYDTSVYIPATSEYSIGDSINVVAKNPNDYDFYYNYTTTIEDVSTVGASTALSFSDSVPLDASSKDIFVYSGNEIFEDIFNTENASTGEQAFYLDTSIYAFKKDQLVAVIINDNSTGYQWAASHRVLDTYNTTTHKLEGKIQPFIVKRDDRFTYNVKHAFTTFTKYNSLVNTAEEVNNNFHIYNIDRSNNRDVYLDDTFVYYNVLFDYDYVEDNWLDSSVITISDEYYPTVDPITVDGSGNIILRSLFDSSTYMLNQKNIWVIKRDSDDSYLMRVYNKALPYFYDSSDNYNVQVESYDKYGNLTTRLFEGFIKVE